MRPSPRVSGKLLLEASRTRPTPLLSRSSPERDAEGGPVATWWPFRKSPHHVGGSEGVRWESGCRVFKFLALFPRTEPPGDEGRMRHVLELARG